MMTESPEYDPHQHRYVERPISNCDAFISLVKCAIGTGCLAMPKAFYHAGYLNGIISTLVIGVIMIYSLHLLIKSMYELCKRKHRPQLSYIQSMMIALKEGPPFLRCLSKPMGVLVDLFLGFYHFGVCCVYVMFIAENLKQVIDFYFFEMDSRLYMVLLIVPLITLIQTRDLKPLVPFFAVANIFFFFGFAAVLYYILLDLPPLHQREAFQSLALYPLFFGTVLFAIESIGVLIAIEANMRNPKDFLGLTGILNRSMFVVIFIYCSFGFLGYWRYGPDIQDSITLNLPDEDILPQLVKILFSLSIFFSYALQGYVAVDIIWYHSISHLIRPEEAKPLEFVARMAIALASVLLAILCPNFGLFLALIGSLCLSFLCLICPAILDLCIKYQVSYGFLGVHLVKDIFLLSFGMVGGALGTWVAVEQIVNNVEFIF